MWGLVWIPGGRIVYAQNDSSGSSDQNLWQIGVDNHTGMPTTKPKRITQWAGSSLAGELSASADGDLALLKTSYQKQAEWGELTDGGTRMSSPRRLINDDASDSPNGWTADSKAVLFDSDVNGSSGIFKREINGSIPETLVAGPQDLYNPQLSSDGAWILYLEKASAPVGKRRLMRIPANGGVPQLVMDTLNPEDFHCARAPASLCVVYETSPDQKQFLITAFDPLKGRGKVLKTIDSATAQGYRADLSPDESTLAVSRTNESDIHIRLLSLSGGSDREITAKGWPNITDLQWSHGGTGFYAGSDSPKGSALLYVDLKGSARVLWQYKGSQAGVWSVPSPDGRYLAIGHTVRNSNVWVINGF